MGRDLWAYAQALWRHWAGLLAGPTATVLLFVWQVFAKTDIAPWVFWLIALTGIPLAGFLAWRDERKTTRPADMKIGDKAVALKRTLTASYQHCPNGPTTPSDYINWASQLNNGFGHTDAALKEILELRPDASRKVLEAVGHVRDAYYDTANLLNPLFFSSGPQGMALVQPAGQPVLQRAFTIFRRCLAELDVAAAAKE